jgi:hypothetical protein
MSTPEIPKNPNLVCEYISYEYAGNCADNIRFNDIALRSLDSFLGQPQRTLIIQDGTDRVEGFNLVLTEFRGWPATWGLSQRKSPARLRTISNHVLLTIESQVIDGRIQTAQRKENFNQNEYQRRFINRLVDIISWGIHEWAEHEFDQTLKDQSIFKRFREKGRFNEFWKNIEDVIVIPKKES